jgi:serine/threonine protein kinase
VLFIAGQNILRYALTERNVLGYINHPFIVGLHFAFQTSAKLCLVLDYCPGGDLSKYLRAEKKFSEQKAKYYLCEIILALEELHRRDIIYRDLKPDNVVLDESGHCKLTDFGLSKEGVMEHTTGTGSFCGSVAYLAPEILMKSGHGKAVDWYLLGVIFYEMVVGTPPYYAATKEELFYNIEKAPLKIPASLSAEAKLLFKNVSECS